MNSVDVMSKKNMRTNEQGFTLLEVCIVTGVMVLLVLFALFILRPASFKKELESAERRTEVAAIAQGLQRYKAAKGQFPSNIPLELKAIGSPEEQFNLCPLLVPAYLGDIPIDPGAGAKFLGYDVSTAICSTQGVEYGSGYGISRGVDGSVTISAPSAVGEKIEITAH